MKRNTDLRHGLKMLVALAAWCAIGFGVMPLGAQTDATQTAAQVATETTERQFRLEGQGFNNAAGSGLGNWWGGGLDLSWRPSPKVMAEGSFVSERRPGANDGDDAEHLAALRALVDWTKWFYTDMTISGGGRDDPAAFFPRLRYDLSANVKIPWAPGLILTGGLTRLYFGAPVGGRIRRAGAIYYWRRFVFQGYLNFNNARPGNHKSMSGNGAAQYGQEGRYWFGVAAGRGREAWQTLALTPQDVEFTSYSASAFLRKWLAPNYGVAMSYGYTLKHTAYRINTVEAKFFWEF